VNYRCVPPKINENPLKSFCATGKITVKKRDIILDSLHILQDGLLITAYQNAIKLNLSRDFINLLLNEIEKRNLLINEIA
jgi:hypothetical protein